MHTNTRIVMHKNTHTRARTHTHTHTPNTPHPILRRCQVKHVTQLSVGRSILRQKPAHIWLPSPGLARQWRPAGSTPIHNVYIHGPGTANQFASVQILSAPATYEVGPQ